jgi:hypothetical protein
LLAGCGSKEAALVGTWKIKDIQLPKPMADNPQVKAQADLAKTKFSLDLKADKHFEIATTGGTWALSANKVTLTIATIGGKTIDDAIKEAKEKAKGNKELLKQIDASPRPKPLVLTLSPDSKSLTLVQSTPPVGDTTLVLAKDEK